LQWSSDVEDKLNEVLDVSNIIFGLKQAGTAYVNACFPNKKTIGTLILPEINMVNWILFSLNTFLSNYFY